jgi:guanylate kinase
MATTLVVVSAPSGAGKTTLCKKLLEEFPNLVLSISCTTRQKRFNEEEGRDYFFLSKEDFEKKIAAGGFAEWARVHDNLYGTSKEFIEKAFKAGKSLLLDIDVQGAESLRKAYPKDTLRVFIAPPSIKALEQRLIDRGTDDARTIQRRLNNARHEMEKAREFDHVVVNDSLEQAYHDLSLIVRGRLASSPSRK